MIKKPSKKLQNVDLVFEIPKVRANDHNGLTSLFLLGMLSRKRSFKLSILLQEIFLSLLPCIQIKGKIRFSVHL
jgi:hypothetical protein